MHDGRDPLDEFDEGAAAEKTLPRRSCFADETTGEIARHSESERPKGFESESLSDAVASGSESVANSESPSVVGGAEDDDAAAVSDGIEEMSEADETDSDSDEYVPSLEDSEDIFCAAGAPLRARYLTAGQADALWLRPGQKPNSQF